MSLAPWLAVQDGAAAVRFYKEAFGAQELYRLEEGGRLVVAQLSIGGAELWLQEDGDNSPLAESRLPVRMIWTVDDPDAQLARAAAAGATVVYPVQNQHGWRIGRIADPFGHHWEIGKRLDEPPQHT